MAELGALLGRRDPDPVRRGKQFERICQWFLTHDPVYAGELRRVWLWKDWPGRWDADADIDLVAEDRRGDLWAIQAKAYDPARRITKRDVDTFPSGSWPGCDPRQARSRADEKRLHGHHPEE